MKIKFDKMEGLGNDFILFDNRKNVVDEKSYGSLSKKLCDRRFGIGADGIILALKPEKKDIGFRIFNNDGSEAEMCGNGMRCFARYVYEKGIVEKKIISVETKAGLVIPELLFEGDRIVSVKVDMGEPELRNQNIPFISDNEKSVSEKIEIDGENYSITTVSMGNPHAVIFVDSLDFDIEKAGKKIENHTRFPNRTNVEFAMVKNPRLIEMRVWERGAGETLACGTGACAVLVSANRNKLSERSALVKLKGGDLEIEWAENDHIYKKGPATKVFDGIVEI